MSKPALQWISGFMAAARVGNLTRAAEQLNVTVSALSHQLRRLEERLGLKLMRRGPRGVALTDEGRALFERLDPHYQAIERLLQPHRTARGDTLSLSTLSSFANAWLIPRLNQFVQAHCEIQLSLDSSVELVDFDKQLHMDAALRFGAGHWPRLHACFLFKEWLTPAASPNLLSQLTDDQLANLHLCPLIDDSSGRWKSWFARQEISPPKRFVAKFHDAESAQRAAAEGVGIALVRHVLAGPLLQAGRLRLLSETKLEADYSYYLVYPERSAQHRGLLQFKTWLLDQVAADVNSTSEVR